MAETEIASDGLPARVIKAHSLEKFDRHAKYCATFNNAMRYHWPDNRGYLELFAGPGLAIDEDTREEVDGCPLIAAGMSQPGFSRLAFVEYEPELAAALEQRLRARGNAADRAIVIAGDANDHAAIASALAFLPNPGLVYAFVDPEDINNEWHAIEFLATRPYPRVDVLINLPINAIERAVGRGHFDPISRVVGHDRWIAEVNAGGDPATVIRHAYLKQLESLKFAFVRDKQITISGTSRNIYDLFFASRNPRATQLWDSIERIQPSGQRKLDLGL